MGQAADPFATLGQGTDRNCRRTLPRDPGGVTDAKTIAAANPDIILMAWCGAGDRVPLEQTASRRGWNHLNAIENARVYCIADELLNTPAPTLLEGLRALASAIHPELFSGHAPGRLRRIEIQAEESKLK